VFHPGKGPAILGRVSLAHPPAVAPSAYSNTLQQAVAQFHAALYIPAPSHPTMLAADRVELRCSLIEEEAKEFRIAATTGRMFGMIDALVDLLYVTFGAAVEMGIDLDPFFSEVHASNMRKLPHPHAEKAIKGSNWTPPDIAGAFWRLYGSSVSLALSGFGRGRSSKGSHGEAHLDDARQLAFSFESQPRG
jgi:phosphoribosyl-ATP pyrophosphohydrolase